MPFAEAILLMLERGELTKFEALMAAHCPPREYNGSRFVTEGNVYICSNQGTDFHPKWRWFTM
jgi:hypothetical protein